MNYNLIHIKLSISFVIISTPVLFHSQLIIGISGSFASFIERVKEDKERMLSGMSVEDKVKVMGLAADLLPGGSCMADILSEWIELPASVTGGLESSELLKAVGEEVQPSSSKEE